MIEPPFVVIGIGIGIVIAAPIGPVNVMCINRAFRGGFVAGLTAGLGAVLADGVFSAIAAYGLTAIADFVEGYGRYIQLVGGIMLIGFGVMIARLHPHLDDVRDTAKGTPLAGTAAAFAMTITNPGAMLGVLAVFGSLGEWTPEDGDFLGATELVLGVMAGSLAWWASVASLVGLFRKRLNDETLALINFLSGLALAAAGAVILIRLVWTMI